MTSSQQPKKNLVGVCLCGFGRAGNIHFNCIRRNHRYSLKYVVDVVDSEVTFESGEKIKVGELIRRRLDEFNLQHVEVVDTRAFETRVLADPEVGAVVIATPTFTHEDYVTKSLAAKKAVFCEKPLADTLEAVCRCYDTAASLNVPLYCAFNRRFDPGMAGVKQGVREGKIGKVYSIKTTSRDSPRPCIEYIKVSGGMFHDCGVHDFDLVCWVLGEAPEAVMAMASTFDPEYEAAGDIDTTTIILKFPSKALATIELCRLSNHGYDQRLEVFGDKGMLQCSNRCRDPVLYTTETGASSSALLYSFPQRYDEAYMLEHVHFLDCVLDRSLPICVSKRDTVLATKIADACIKSYKEGRTVPIEL